MRNIGQCMRAQHPMAFLVAHSRPTSAEMANEFERMAKESGEGKNQWCAEHWKQPVPNSTKSNQACFPGLFTFFGTHCNRRKCFCNLFRVNLYVYLQLVFCIGPIVCARFVHGNMGLAGLARMCATLAQQFAHAHTHTRRKMAINFARTSQTPKHMLQQRTEWINAF